MKNKKVWIALIALIALLGVGYFFSRVSGTYGQADILSAINGLTVTTASAQEQEDLSTTAIRSASEADQVSAAGNIELSSQRPVVLQADGIVTTWTTPPRSR
jgi:hypothetical protein